MASTTLGIKVDSALRERLKAAAEQLGRTPHWFLKQAVIAYLEQVEAGRLPPELVHLLGQDGVQLEAGAGATALALPAGQAIQQPFFEFAQGVAAQSVLRAAITAAYRRPEPECVPLLIEQARDLVTPRVTALAETLVVALRGKRRSGGVEGLVQEFSLSSQEGVALMCLAEALLRIPDRATRDALIRDKISGGDWQAHVGHSASLFVNAATWGLVLTGKLVSTNSEQSLSRALTKLIGKGGEPLIRKGVDMAMRMMGEQFVTGERISEALANSRKFEAMGFRYSYDMLGEAATTSEDAQRYYGAYEQAIHAIGMASNGRGIYDGPGISIKLSALHPRYVRAQQERVMAELLPRVLALAQLARHYDIGMNIDAEESDRLEISLDLLEALCFDDTLQGWNGIGFVVQAYQKRAPYVIDHVIDLARRSRHRVMVRLVKGAYWDSEIKRAQIDGLEGYPVYTRKVYTDLSYLACARKLLAAPEAVFPQFATHNAQTVATIYHMAGQNYYAGQYEFQCLHGMGEPLYEEIVGPVAQGGLNRPCRIYAPVGTHETLLAYLVRRLLENGANTSFVNLIGNANIDIATLVADPVGQALKLSPPGLPHERIPLPRDLFRINGQGRLNAAGIDLDNEQRLASLAPALLGSGTQSWRAAPVLGDTETAWDDSRSRAVPNPADHRDIVGHVMDTGPDELERALRMATHSAPIWQSTPVSERAQCLMRAADLLEARMPHLLGLIVREAGKTLPNAVAEVREAVDFLRYYADRIQQSFSNDTHRPLGVVLCISPWNFPLAIFTGQVAAALAAGNTVLAKPAEQTCLVAAQMIGILHEAGILRGAVQMVPGDGERVGATLVADRRVHGVMFTGSTEVAQGIACALAQRLDDRGRTIPLIAETGGQNALIVDSSALAEQVVADVLASAFDSAGQRCSALRLLCLQEEIADRTLTMLRGAMRELIIGNPDRLQTDVGPVIDQAAQEAILDYIESCRAQGCVVDQAVLPEQGLPGTFVVPTLIEIDTVSRLGREVFGPVLHVLRYRREALGTLIDDINATGYGLTFGVHTRIDEMIEFATQRIRAGNIYVNRNVIGAVVGVQPFGGEGLSGTGPKAGGPLYLYRLLSVRPSSALQSIVPDAQALPCVQALPGPTGERNAWILRPRGTVLCVAATAEGAQVQWDAAKSCGNRAMLAGNGVVQQWWTALPEAERAQIGMVGDGDIDTLDGIHAVLFEGDSDALLCLNQRIAARPGPILSVQGLTTGEIQSGARYACDRLVSECALSVNTAAAGGNASLMSIG
ncbi:trifunctional transcriptional regulator/proline dehydrogenase/L-glutamate gamma-semialdehyde dehydrogenase [Corticimicrobacter populi]|uniref:Bifunctional protein PutA n=1 Tax=Corticimicrobacter populi TaxID=2175229 RepID=A0A2V1K3C4_9BURK|nr:trifunctional transcriptional regulator/proline dehydrogenase/L-glutamate gamma-semialdehyde dehydrogenase [Corticimicrobacter populi]PWF22948.1 trifunctional transcriptional regulator/proline dehydrogenase/L-glutamate gamma-semialdehyde dehydrogenase [Corticimicrobacter populi]